MLKPTGWLSWHIGGDKSLDESFEFMMAGLPKVHIPRQILVYALGTMGYHFCDALNMILFKERTSDFYEMTLHHVATVALYFCMIFGNAMTIGCLIAFLHDIADVFVACTKTLSTMNKDYDGYAFSFFACMILAWIWTRLYVLPRLIYRIFANKFDP